MNDLISRQAAIDAVKGRFSMPVDNLIVEVIGALPSAQPERKEGTWIVRMQRGNWNDREYKTCSECGMTFVDLDVANFCPNCGAKMGGEQE